MAGGEAREARVRRVTPEELAPGQATPGMTRHEAVAVKGVWSGLVHTEPGGVSGWHHHGDHDTIANVLSGRLRIEYGPGGGEVVQGEPGDFLHVPPHVVHREGNPAADAGSVVVVRAGTGPVVVNVEGPEPTA